MLVGRGNSPTDKPGEGGQAQTGDHDLPLLFIQGRLSGPHKSHWLQPVPAIGDLDRDVTYVDPDTAIYQRMNGIRWPELPTAVGYRYSDCSLKQNSSRDWAILFKSEPAERFGDRPIRYSRLTFYFERDYPCLCSLIELSVSRSRGGR